MTENDRILLRIAIRSREVERITSGTAFRMRKVLANATTEAEEKKLIKRAKKLYNQLKVCIYG